jgi:CelD/BcsL family acetyltransferase involved in cellulose biosynthesis
VDQLLAVREGWERLLARAATANVFLTPEWLIAWCRYYVKDAVLRVIVVYEDGELIGLAPLLVEQQSVCGIPLLKQIKFLGAGLSDRLDILAASGKERAALEQIVGWLFAQGWDVWDVDELPEASPTAELLPWLARRWGAPVEVVRQSVCPMVKLPNDVAAYRSTRHREFWKKVDYYGRRLRKEHALEVRFNEGAADLGRDLECFLDVYRASFAARPSPLTDRRFADFRRDVVGEMARQKRILLALLFVDGTPVSGQLCLLYQRSCYAYNLCHDPSFSKQSVGTVLQWEVLQYLIEHGYKEYDFLRGAEAYKYRWGACSVYHQRIRIWRNTRKVRLVRAALRVRRRSRQANLSEQAGEVETSEPSRPESALGLIPQSGDAVDRPHVGETE